MSGAILSVHSEYHLLLMCGRLGGCRKRRFAVFSKKFFCAKITARRPTFCRKTWLHPSLSVFFVAKSADLSAC